MLKSKIKKILLEQLDKTEEKPLSKREITFFKELNKVRHKYPTKKELLTHIRDMMPFIGKSPNEGRLYYEIYTQNYRPEGDYENITFDNFKNYKDFKQKTITNSTAYEYSAGKIPFKGSNLEGFWEVNRKNQWYYVVESYGWYPIFLFINDKWYGNINNYSSSTAKQMSNANPISYNSGLGEKVTYLRKGDLDKLMSGVDYENVNKDRIGDFKKYYENKIGKSKLITIGSRWRDNQKKARFRVMDIKNEGDMLNITIYVDKAGNVVNNKMVDNVEDYTQEFANDIEEGIRDYIIRENQEFLTHKNTEFRFIHP